MKPITGRLTEKNGKWYAVINLPKLPGEKRKQPWKPLNLDSRKGSRIINKTQAEARLAELVAQYNRNYDFLEVGLSRAEQEQRRIARQPFHEYLVDWFDGYKSNLALRTQSSYRMILEGRVIPYFKGKNIPIKDLVGSDFNTYYNHLRKDGLSGKTALNHHRVMHLALKHAVKRGIIPYNPSDQADPPKAEKHVGEYYNAQELKKLLSALKDDPLRVPVIIAIYCGLRRSEILGIKWSAIDFENKVIRIRHKIIEDDTTGVKKIVGIDMLKTDSSYRTMPLLPEIEEELLREREIQAERKSKLRSAYSRKWEDYVCVDAMGEIIKPQYFTEHFKVILRQNGLKEIRLHDLRHSCASLLVANDEDMKLVQNYLGHSTISITADTYSHLEYKSKEKSARKISRALSD